MPGTYVEFPVTESSRIFLDLLVSDVLGLKPLEHGYHVTSVFSRQKITYYRRRSVESPITARITGWLFLKGRNDLGLCLALAIHSYSVVQSHKIAMKAGATWDYPKFIPHITLAYDLEVDNLIERVLPSTRFNSTIYLEPERIMGLDENWKPIRRN